jgi:hypothetical protein
MNGNWADKSFSTGSKTGISAVMMPVSISTVLFFNQ